MIISQSKNSTKKDHYKIIITLWGSDLQIRMLCIVYKSMLVVGWEGRALEELLMTHE